MHVIPSRLVSQQQNVAESSNLVKIFSLERVSHSTVLRIKAQKSTSLVSHNAHCYKHYMHHVCTASKADILSLFYCPLLIIFAGNVFMHI